MPSRRHMLGLGGFDGASDGVILCRKTQSVGARVLKSTGRSDKCQTFCDPPFEVETTSRFI